MKSTDVLVCGAGIAGVSAAFHLARRGVFDRILLVDQRRPLTLTSARGTEAYRNWWPDPVMVAFMNRSIDLLERRATECDNRFAMNRRGYVFFTADDGEDAVARKAAEAERMAALGAGPLRRHRREEEYRAVAADRSSVPVDGADLIEDPGTIRRCFPYVTEEARTALHVRRAGWLDAVELGRWLLERARRSGVELMCDRVVDAEIRGGRVVGVRLAAAGQVAVGSFVAAPGPLLPDVLTMLELDLPLANELHGRIDISDSRRVVPDDAPLLIWDEPVELEWSQDERRRIAAEPEWRDLLEPLPPAVHCRPRRRGGERRLLGVWTYDVQRMKPVFPPPFDRRYADVVLRGLTRLIPGVGAYLGSESKVDGGYYCRTPENRPLVGPLPVGGAYVVGALSGFGIMGSQAAGDLLARHLADEELPGYADSLHPDRYEEPAYRAELDRLMARDGQL